MELLKVSAGAVLAGIGPYTQPGVPGGRIPGHLVGDLGGGPGRLGPTAGRRPAPEMDWNVQRDTGAARMIFDVAEEMVLVTLPARDGAGLSRV